MDNRKKYLFRHNGFTLVELLIVVVILGVLAGLTVPRLAGRAEKAKIKAAESDIKGGIGLALDLYESDMGRYPERLEELAGNVSGDTQWDGPYVKGGLPKDPWGNAYFYTRKGTHNSRIYDLYSAGPDRSPGTADDIANWELKAS